MGKNSKGIKDSPMSKRKLTAKEKEAKRIGKRDFMYIFINGKQKRVRRPPTIDGLDVDEFIRRNADPLSRHQNEMWELIECEEQPATDHLACLDDVPF